jgi:F-box/leucine-rich repeat protein 2/20
VLKALEMSKNIIVDETDLKANLKNIENINFNVGIIENVEVIVYKQSILISLPLVVSRYFLNSWLEIKNISFLDNAFCNKHQRSFFFNILSELIIRHDFSDKDLQINTDLYLQWILKRNIYIKNLCINKWNESIFDYLQNNGNNRQFVLKSLSFTLGFNNCENFDEDILLELFNSKNLKNLIGLYFWGFYLSFKIITDRTLIAIANNFVNLQILYLNSSYQITDEGIVAIANNCLKLENISLSCNNNVTDISLIVIANNCKNLKLLDLNKCEKITDNGLKAIANKCLKLENIDISILNITDFCLIEISKNCFNLKILNIGFFISNNKNITDHGIIAIARNCKFIEVLNLEGNVDITDFSLTEISNNCKNLKLINFVRCRQITDVGIIAIANNCFKLEDISLSNNDNVTDLSLIAISKNCLNLKVLNLSKCYKIAEKGIILIAKNCLKVEELNLNGNKKITNFTLFEIAKNCLNLKLLNLDDCTKITNNNGLIAVAKNCLKLKELKCDYETYIKDKNVRFKNLKEIMKRINSSK